MRSEKNQQRIVLKLERVSVEAKVKEDRRGGGRGGDGRLGAIKQRTDCVYQYKNVGVMKWALAFPV